MLDYETQYDQQHNGQGQKASHGERIIAANDVSKLAERAFKDGARSMASADLDKTVKVFGVEVDQGLANWAASAYNVVSDFGTRALAPKTYEITTNLVSPHLTPGATAKTAAIATFAVNTGLKSAMFVPPMIKSVQETHAQERELARKLAPVLDDIKNSHSVGAMKSVRMEDNSIIRAHVWQMHKKHGVQNFNSFLDLIVNAGPNVALNLSQLGGMYSKGLSPKELAKQTQLAKQQQVGDDSVGGQMKELGKLFVNSSTGTISGRIKKSNENNLKKRIQPYSALEMLLTLGEQVESNAKARTFQVPGRRGESYPLEEYLMRVMIHHQKELADISPEQSEVREALREELALATKPIAEAVRKGELSGMALVRMLGEGHVVKRHGRAVASPEEVEEYIEKNAGTRINRVVVDPKEFYADASYSKADLQEVLKVLEGEEKQTFAAWVPDDVLEDAGMKPEAIKQLRVDTAKTYERSLAEAVLGLAAKSEEELKADGLAKSEITQLYKARDALEANGLGAIADLKTSSANIRGVERLVTNAAVPQIKRDKTYLGKLTEAGRDAAEKVTTKDAAAEPVARGFADKFADRAPTHANDEHANDDFAGREAERRHQADKPGHGRRQ